MRSIRRHISTHGARFKWAIVFSLLTACVDPIAFKVPKGGKFLVVEGLITDQPGPYSVTLSKSFTTDVLTYGINPERNAKVSLYADGVFLEDLVETEDGIYETTNVVGTIGRSYSINIETADGKRYTSEPEILRPVGDVTAVRAKFEPRTIQTPDGEKNGDRFSIYVDGNITDEPESFVRWRFAGTYLIRTNPELAYIFLEGVRVPRPYECSGYGVNGMLIKYLRPCTCCTCWVTEYDDRWFLGSSADVTEAGYKGVFVGQANVNSLTFLERYHVEIQQMSLSPKAYEFFRQLTAQSDGVSSLFQPSTGAIKGNINAVDSDERVLGLFYTSSITSRSIELMREEVPYILPPPDTIRNPCNARLNSTNKQPAFW